MATATTQLVTNYADIVTAGAIVGAQKFFALDAKGFISLLIVWDGTGNVIYVYTVAGGIPSTDPWMSGATIISPSGGAGGMPSLLAIGTGA